jgi:hypothetical protein
MRERSQTVNVAVLAGLAVPDSPTALRSNSPGFDGMATPQKSLLSQRVGSATPGNDAGRVSNAGSCDTSEGTLCF